jgi:hypothetical protein
MKHSMLEIPKGAHIVTTKREYKGKTYRAHLLRHSFREGGKVHNETLSNLTALGDDLVELLRKALRGEPVGVLGQQFDIVRSWHHGHVLTVMTAMERLGMAKLLASRTCRERSLVLAMVAARILAPASKLATANWFSDTTLLAELGLESATEEDLYAAMDWLAGQQAAIEKRLASRHLQDGGLVLYDLSSTWMVGTKCPLAARGYSRDGKKGTLQVNFGLVADSEGRPIAVDVFKGNVGDPKTVMPQVERVKDRFGIKQFVMVGDRGMITQKHIDTLVKDHPGVQWITALRTEAIRGLVEDKSIHPELFDDKNLFELTHDAFPGERLVACRNQPLGRMRAQKRLDLLKMTEIALEKVVARVGKGRLKDAGKIGLAVGRVLNKYKMAKHFSVTITEGNLTYERQQAAIDAEAALDGLYVIRTSVPKEDRTAEQSVHDYKRLTQVEHAFRSIKTVDLHVRPIWHYDEKRVKSHIFLCMLAYYVQWHLERALAPLTFADDQPADRRDRDPVAPAQPREAVRKKAADKQDAGGQPVARLHRVLGNMATIVRNQCRWKGSDGDPTFDVETTPSQAQRRVLTAVEAIALWH